MRARSRELHKHFSVYGLVNRMNRSEPFKFTSEREELEVGIIRTDHTTLSVGNDNIQFVIPMDAILKELNNAK